MINKERLAVDATRRDIRAYIADQPERISKINEKTRELNQQAFRLFVTYNMEEKNPVEMRDILRQMTIVRDQALSLVAPVKEQVKFIENLKKIVGTHVGEYERLATDSSMPGIHEAANQYVAELKETVGLLESAESIVDIIPNAVEQLLGRLEP